MITRVDELYSVADVLAAEPQVRRAIADPAAAVPARTGLVRAGLRRQGRRARP